MKHNRKKKRKINVLLCHYYKFQFGVLFGRYKLKCIFLNSKSLEFIFQQLIPGEFLINMFLMKICNDNCRKFF